MRSLSSSGSSASIRSFGSSHQRVASSASMVASSKRRRTTRAGLPATMA